MIINCFWVNRYFSSRWLRADNEVVVVGTGPDNCGLDKRCGKKGRGKANCSAHRHTFNSPCAEKGKKGLIAQKNPFSLDRPAPDSLSLKRSRIRHLSFDRTLMGFSSLICFRKTGGALIYCWQRSFLSLLLPSFKVAASYRFSFPLLRTMQHRNFPNVRVISTYEGGKGKKRKRREAQVTTFLTRSTFSSCFEGGGDGGGLPFQAWNTVHTQRQFSNPPTTSHTNISNCFLKKYESGKAMCIYFCMLIVFFNSIEKLKQSLSVNSKEVVAWFLFVFFSPPPLLSPIEWANTNLFKKRKKIFSRTRTDVLTPSALWRGGCQSDSSPRRKRRRRKRRRKENKLKYYSTQMQQKHIQSQVGKKRRGISSH